VDGAGAPVRVARDTQDDPEVLLVEELAVVLVWVVVAWAGTAT